MKSYEFIFAIRDRSTSSGIAQHILLILASRADDHGYCYPSYRDIARVTGYSLRTIARAIKQIPSDELQIVCEGGSSKGGERQATKYRILIRNRSHSDHGQSENHSQSNHGQNIDRSHSDYRTVVRESTDRSHSDHPTYQERTNERTKARKRARGSSSATDKQTGQDADPLIPETLRTLAFQDAWAAFDQHRRNGKARKEWTTHAKTIALKKCAEFGPVRAVTAIENSILNGWKGIFEPNGSSNHKPKSQERLDEFGLPHL
jgi:Helix-turn-helix domain